MTTEEKPAEEELSTAEIDEGLGGRPAFEPRTDDFTWVLNAASIGVPQEFIVKRIINPHTSKPIDLKTLRKHFRANLDEGLVTMANGLLTTGYDIATDKEHSSCAYMNQFLLKTRCGFKETSVTELLGADGESLGIPQLVVFKGDLTGLPAVAFEDNPSAAE